MKFKVGDKVKFVNNLGMHGSHVKLKEIFTIIDIDSYENNIMPYHAKNETGYGQWFREEELELVKYTYEDLKKSPIGTKVTFENGKVFVKDDKETYENIDNSRCECELVNLKDNNTYEDFGKIIKIEEPTYTTVYEFSQDILTEAEKNYLKTVISPVKDKVLNITKTQQRTSTARKFIDIEIQNDDCICLSFIDENSELSYKGMKTEHPYTFQELGL